jgi:uncharacterized protein with NAD-binding domain and iron-sulfur cluster
MTVAHELALRDEFDVTVYELRDLPGGKARSIDASVGASAGLTNVPGEHGFRFFPGFYRHLPDTMSRIPYQGQYQGVLANLVVATASEFARSGGRRDLIAPAQLSPNQADWQAALNNLLAFARSVEIPVNDALHFVHLIGTLLSACHKRRLEQFELQSWWEFAGAQQRSEPYRQFLADGLSRSLVAAQAREMSARTGGYILLQLMQASSRRGGQVDRLLKGPTSVMWIDPWLEELRRLGVTYRLSCCVDSVLSEGGRVTGVRGHEVSWSGGKATAGPAFEDRADLYVAAVPVEVMQRGISLGDLKARCPALAKIDGLRTRWMNGIQFYLSTDVPIVHGHTIYIDSPWALTSVSQRQFWPSIDFTGYGDGRVGGVLSVDISDWETPGVHAAGGKVAKACTRQEIADEVWAQMKDALNDETPLLDDRNLRGWFLDPDIVSPNPPTATQESVNLEPLLINTKGSWDLRPEGSLLEVENLFLASDYVQTFTDLATMEGANEAARRAVNSILEVTGSSARPCDVWPLEEAGGFLFASLRAVDNVVYRLLGSRRPPPSPVTMKNGKPQASFAAAAGHVIRRTGARR